MLGTSRLILRPIKMNDIAAMREIFSCAQITDPHVMLPITTDQRLVSFMGELIKAGELIISLKDDGSVIGTIGLFGYSQRHKRGEVGFGILPAYWNLGYATEAVRAYVGYVFTELDINRLEAFVNPDYVYSIQLMERLGFTREGFLKQRSFFKGEYQDYLLYRLLKEEWGFIH